ncbi:MAG: mechanosensitive ion channel [Devosia sp.]|uniref:mechanosensitive ion channel domain-containing protein n=1 Tax=Devosia sp. TaxID=1871048 RepID=UPI002636AE87|nr:mechanosensitive ion channel domain-containing protein [Devosia sp.]MDB5528747.1 mechanosensitive ion channel [Devosia sp.]
MRLLIALLLVVLSLPSVAMAQVPVPAETAAPADASIDELIRIIENDDTRAVLLERLRQTTTGETATPVETAPDLSIARQLAEYTRRSAEGVSSTFRAVGEVFVDLRQGFGGEGADLSALGDVAIGVLIVGAALLASFLGLRVIVIWLQRRIAARVAGKRWYMRLAGALAAAAIDVGSVVLAWALGNVLALSVTGTPGSMGINQSLLLNAFLLVELSKVVLRTLLQPRFETLRLVPVSDSNAAYWSFWLGRIVSLLGYTFMLVSPVIAANLSMGIAAAVQVLVMATAVTIGIVIVLQCKDGVRAWLGRMAEKRSTGAAQVLLLIGRIWHVVAITYLVALLIVWFANPTRALPFMLGATVQTAIAILVGMLVVMFVSRFVDAGLHLPKDISQKLPLLEKRLHAFVPRVMGIVRWIVIAGVVLAVAQAWALFDFVGWISSDGGQQVAVSVISAALIVLVCIALHVAVASWVEYRLNDNAGVVATNREKTLLNLFKNAFTIALVVFGLMLALAQIGVNIAPLLAGAGVLGLAIGFGAQKLVQDIITGIFIQFENVMNEGDVVEAAGKSGVVEKLTIRSVTIRDMSGTVHLIPFSSVDQVSNMVRGFSFYVAEIEVAYDSDIEAVKQALRDAFALVMESEHKDVILDELDLQGLIAITPASMTLRARIKTIAGKQWGAGRYFSELVMRLFAERGIQVPTQSVRYVEGRGPTRGLPLAGELPNAGE